MFATISDAKRWFQNSGFSDYEWFDGCYKPENEEKTKKFREKFGMRQFMLFPLEFV
jgi:peptidoglycan hydrolase-like protein with peptidoglycan-binding domain